MLVKMGKVIYDILQGSTLGPTFFQIFIYDIDTHISGNLFLYADVTYVAVKDSNLHHLQISIHKNNKRTRGMILTKWSTDE